VEHITGKQLLLHLETTECSASLLPQSIARVGHDGKEIKDIREIDPDIAEDLDPWHFKKGEMTHFRDHCLEHTKCKMGNKKLGISGDTKEVKEMKMKRRKHLLTLQEGLGFHLLRCCYIVWVVTSFALMRTLD